MCERVTVLRDGRHVITRPTGGLTEPELVRAMIGRDLPPATSAARPPGPVRLAVQRLSSPGRFANVSFELRAGEILGLAGLVGAGRIGDPEDAVRAGSPRSPARSGWRARRSIAGACAVPRRPGRWAWGWCPRTASARGWCWG